jgi:hypothetical protein
MAFTNRFEADISPKKTRLDAKAYQKHIDLPIGTNEQTGQIYTFRAYVAVPKMQKKVNFKPTILLTIAFFKYKLHIQSRDFDELNSSLRKLSSWLDLQERPIKDTLQKEIDEHDKFEAEYLSRKVSKIIPLKP